eukprot:350021-Chlamydomonas_euryale.AAC.1
MSLACRKRGDAEWVADGRGWRGWRRAGGRGHGKARGQKEGRYVHVLVKLPAGGMSVRVGWVWMELVGWWCMRVGEVVDGAGRQEDCQ